MGIVILLALMPTAVDSNGNGDADGENGDAEGEIDAGSSFLARPRER